MKLNNMPIFSLISLIMLINACQLERSNKLNLFVSIAPQKFFVEKITGSKADVSVFVKTGMSPENFEPLPSQLIKISNADLYFTIGFQFENRITNSISSENPNFKLISTYKDILRKDVKSYEDIFNPNEENTGKVTNEFKDPHIWLSPELVKTQAKTIFNSLINIDPTNFNYYKNNFDFFLHEIDSVQNIIAENLNGLSNRNVLVYHPAWGYFCDEFNLKQIPVEIEGKEPSVKELSGLLDFIKGSQNKFILAESQNISPSLNSITEELGIKIIKHDPLDENYFESMITLSKIIKENQ